MRQRKTIRILLILLAALPAQARIGGKDPEIAQPRDKGPATMNLKERFAVEGNMPPVIFTHRHHQQLLACRECHRDPEGGGELRFEITRKISVRNDFHAKACWPCHLKMKVKGGTECGYCHGRRP